MSYALKLTVSVIGGIFAIGLAQMISPQFSLFVGIMLLAGVFIFDL